MNRSTFGSFILISVLLGFGLGRCSCEDTVPCEPCRPCAPCEPCEPKIIEKCDLDDVVFKCKAWNIRYEEAATMHKNSILNTRPAGCDIRSDNYQK